jgi:hypothetical protein
LVNIAIIQFDPYQVKREQRDGQSLFLYRQMLLKTTQGLILARIQNDCFFCFIQPECIVSAVKDG